MSRRRAARPPMSTRASAAVLLVAALATGQALERLLPEPSDTAAPFERPGAVGESVRLRYGTVEVGEPSGSTRLDADGVAYSTTGVYVLVPITFTAAGEPQSLSYVALRDTEGRVYVTGTGRNPFSIGTAQPGIPRHTQAAVELPVEAAAGAEVVIALQANDEDHRRDDVAVIDLGISAADAEAWASDDAAVEVEPLVEGEQNEDWT